MVQIMSPNNIMKYLVQQKEKYIVKEEEEL